MTLFMVDLDKNRYGEEGKYVALTFDDGTHQKVTPEVLYILREYEAKATFYMLGIQAANDHALVKQVAKE
ncbi:polysaccharide deacetylase family protein [Alkalihalophilus lindianensis]|uniref:Polysaccharide deacetylase family protein n=1 Tax=Alkalihalophilus lindianensis TaxID=1630542 RepID=A0ABU3XDL5_9BACI|nr:polysaccharide deacetylase family protein [Alkalihalophilus lindianensis]MDV2685981.1 polysaccharide deacetylase family protein [Alkalihalophilus lindianensis]